MSRRCSLRSFFTGASDSEQLPKITLVALAAAIPLYLNTFAGIRGVAVGRFEGFDGYADRGWTLDDVLADHLASLDLPTVRDLPIGPGMPPVPIGVHVTLDATTGVLTI